MSLFVPVDLSEGHCCTRGFGHGAVCNVHPCRPGAGYWAPGDDRSGESLEGWVQAISLAGGEFVEAGESDHRPYTGSSQVHGPVCGDFGCLGSMDEPSGRCPTVVPWGVSDACQCPAFVGELRWQRRQV